MSSLLPAPSRLLLCGIAATIICLGVAVTSAAPSSQKQDEASVRQAALDYVLALYEADASRVQRSVHRDVTKFGYYHNGDRYRGMDMTYDELLELATTYNDGYHRFDPDTTAYEVVVFEVMDKTASARITAHWGVDYMHLANVDGHWRIRNILWQSPTP